jgi:signal recognition particle receptor subunit beta
MPQLNLAAREITLKLVYYGPALSGKTTNLQQLHALLARDVRGEMVTLDTQGDRTLYFDFLPVEFGAAGDYRIKLKLFTVPGQVMHRATRKVVLAGVDAIAFIADSQRSASSASAYSFKDLEANLQGNGIDFASLPKVVQFNKRDLEDTKSWDEIVAAWKDSGIPVLPAVALRGEGVIETFVTLLRALYRSLDQKHDFGAKFGISEEDFLEGLTRPLQEKPAPA